MFEVKTAAPTVNQPSDLFARKYCFEVAFLRKPTHIPKRVIPIKYVASTHVSIQFMDQCIELTFPLSTADSL